MSLVSLAPFMDIIPLLLLKYSEKLSSVISISTGSPSPLTERSDFLSNPLEVVGVELLR